MRTLKTKAMSILLAIVMLMGMLPMNVFAADEGSTGGVEIATAELPAATVGVTYSVTLSATPEGSTFFWNITGLPDGLTADTSGNITGTPEAAGSYTVSVSVGKTGGGSAAKNMTLTVSAAEGEPTQLEAPTFRIHYDPDFPNELLLVYSKVSNTSKYIANCYMEIEGEYHWIGRKSTSSGNLFSEDPEEYYVIMPFFPNGNYYFTMTSVAESSEYLSSEESDYVGPHIISGRGDPFPAPTNLKWDGKVATWDAVDGAASYYIILYNDNEEVTSTYSATAQHDFGSKLTTGGKFSFAVQALGNSTSVLSARSGLANENDLGYAVTINNGTGSGRYNAGDSVSISPNTPEDGYRFGWWDGMDGLSFISTNGTTGECVLRMPERDVTMTAYYEKIPTDYYTMTVIKGKLDAYGGATEAQILEQTMFSFTANEPDAGYQFKEWTWTGVDTLSFANLTTKNSKTAFIAMPSADVTVTAVYEKIPAEAPTVTASGDLTLTYKGYADKQVSVSVTENDGYAYSYQWYDASTDQPISGATNAAYTIPNDLAAGSYSYSCVVTAKRDDNGDTKSSQSDAIAVVVNKATLTADDFNFKKPDILVFYPANFKNATVTAKDGVTGIGAITVQYFDEQGEPQSYAVDAGTYTVKINVAEGDNYLPANSLTADGWAFTITKGTQEVSWSIAGTPETVYGKNDGSITDVYDNMEYRKAGETDADYKAITGNEITGLAAGTYYVRLKETDNLFASAPVTVTIAAGNKLTVTLPQNQIGYTLTANNTELAWHGSTTLAFALADGYSKTNEFSVSATGATLTDNGDGTYTLSNAEDNVTVTVNGVADITAPEAEISISTNRWTEFLNDITFGLFFKETQDITITATDKGSGLDKIYYLISETELTKEAAEALANNFWTEYDAANKPSISPDKECIVYVKVIDIAQKVKVISSNGLVFDATAPTLEGIENGKTYYGDLTVIIPADQFGDIDQVTLDGETMNFAEGTYGRIPADNQEHTVIATDKAGNKTEYKITVYKNYTVDIGECHYVGCVISGGGSYQHGQTVTVTATPTDGTEFKYWLNADIAAGWEDDPSEAELRAAIVSYDATYTFTAEKDVSLEAVFSGSDEIAITAMLIAGTDTESLFAAERWDVEHDFGTVTPGAEQIVLPGELVKDIMTVGNKQYQFKGFIVFGYDEATETETAELKETLTIGKIPLYGSAEYWDWFNSISDGIHVAYMEYTPEEDDGDAPQQPADPETTDDTKKPSSPQTGDNSHLALWIAFAFISGGAVITLTVYDRKRRNTEKN